MNISANQTLHETPLDSSSAANNAPWTDMKDYWNRRKQAQKRIQATHPLYRYPKSPFSNLTKTVLTAKSTSRLEQLSLPRKNFAVLNKDVIGKFDDKSNKFKAVSLNESGWDKGLNSSKKQ